MARTKKTKKAATKKEPAPTLDEMAELLEDFAGGTLEDDMPTVEVEELVSLELAAGILGGVPMAVVANLIRDGVLEAVPLGGQPMVFRSDLTEFIQGRT